MATGENPKNVYGGRNQLPMTRMGNISMERGGREKERRGEEGRGEERRGEREYRGGRKGERDNHYIIYFDGYTHGASDAYSRTPPQ
jgi:hypothetical protein